MKIYFGEWKSQKDMLEYFGINRIPPGIVILAAECTYDPEEEEYQWDIIFLNYGEVKSDYGWSNYLRNIKWDRSADFELVGWKYSSQEFLDRAKEIEAIHVCSI